MYLLKICLLTFSAHFSICLQHKMHCRRGFRPPAVHFMLQINRKSVQKKFTSTVKFYASFKVGVKGLSDDQQKNVSAPCKTSLLFQPTFYILFRAQNDQPASSSMAIV